MKLEETIDELLETLQDKNLSKEERQKIEQEIDEYQQMMKERNSDDGQ